MINREKYLENDDSIVTLYNPEDFKEYLRYRKEHDVWFEPFINEMAAVGIPNEPLFIPGYCKDPEVKKNGYTYKVESLDYDSKEVWECIENTGIFLAIPDSGKFHAYPIRDFAYETICKRAGDDCTTMVRFDSRPNKKVLPVTEKADRLSRDFSLYSDVCRILYRDKKISAALSKEYCIMDNSELIDDLENQLVLDHPDFEFIKAEISHSYLVVSYSLNDPENEETFRLKLNDLGSPVNELKAGVEFCTSDIGLSRVRANIFFDVDDLRIYSEHGIGIRHDSGATTDDFRKACTGLGEALKESEEQIELLGNMKIRNVASVVEKVYKKYSYFPKDIVQRSVEHCRITFPNGGTGIDVYLTLCSIFQEYCKNYDISLNKRINLSESVSKMMKLPFEKIDNSDINDVL